LRLAPWVSWARDQARDDHDSPDPDPYTEAMYDCTACIDLLDAETRRGMRCGWLPGATEGHDEPLDLGRIPMKATECPGKLVQAPEVLEAGRALSWKQEGQLRDFYGGEELTEAAIDALDILGAEIKAVERHS